MEAMLTGNAQSSSKLQGADPEAWFDWRAFVELLTKTPAEREKIGPAWTLFLDICLNADRAGTYSTTYSVLAKRYGVALITVKKWRKHLCKAYVIESFSRGHSVVFRLQEPFLFYLRPPAPKRDKGLQSLLIETMLKAMNDGTLANATNDL